MDYAGWLKTTYILDTTSSCIDLKFTSLINLIINAVVHSSLHLYCHHQIVYANFNLKITYPPLYLRKSWHYKDTNIELIRRALCLIGQKSFRMRVSMRKLTFLTTLNILSNFIPHKKLTCDNKDPPRFNSPIRYYVTDRTLFWLLMATKVRGWNQTRFFGHSLRILPLA